MLKTEKIKIADHYTLYIKEVNYESREKLLRILEEHKFNISYLNDISSERRQLEWLTIRAILAEVYEKAVDIKYNQHGNPQLINHEQNISISHSHQKVAVGLAEKGAIGIDIQQVSEKIRRVQHKFLDISELSLAPQLNDVFLTHCWSAKEASFKLIGEKDVFLSENFKIRKFKKLGEGYQLINLDFQAGDKKQAIQVESREWEDYILAYTLIE
jgi:phosphopantetheinyl transferase